MTIKISIQKLIDSINGPRGIPKMKDYVPLPPKKFFRILTAWEAKELALAKEPELLEFYRKMVANEHLALMNQIYNLASEGMRKVFIASHWSPEMKKEIIDSLENMGYIFHEPNLITW